MITVSQIVEENVLDAHLPVARDRDAGRTGVI
jgi:hypothetical protein